MSCFAKAEHPVNTEACIDALLCIMQDGGVYWIVRLRGR